MKNKEVSMAGKQDVTPYSFNKKAPISSDTTIEYSFSKKKGMDNGGTRGEGYQPAQVWSGK